MKPTGHKALDKALRKLRAALGRLDGTADRPIARRYARKRVLGALRGLRAIVDTNWPALVVIASGARKRLTPEGRMRRLKAQGWVVVSDDRAADFAAVGVSVRKVVTEAVFNAGKSYEHKTTHTHYFVPQWADAIGPDSPTRLRAAKRSVTLRRAELGAAALKA